MTILFLSCPEVGQTEPVPALAAFSSVCRGVSAGQLTSTATTSKASLARTRSSTPSHSRAAQTRTTRRIAAPSTSCLATRSCSSSARHRIFGRPERDASRSGRTRHPARANAAPQRHVNESPRRRPRQAAADGLLFRAARGSGGRPPQPHERRRPWRRQQCGR